MNLSSRSEVRRYLKEHNLTAKKRFGQNFLVDGNYRSRIVDTIDPAPTLTVWEIGPGLGSITEGIVASGASVVLFEIDWGLIRYLEQRFGDDPKVRIVPGDFRKTWQHELKHLEYPTVVAGNLPYRLAATIIGDLLEGAVRSARMVFTIQKEVADRMVASPATSDYSSFSVLVQALATVDRPFGVPPGAFLPVPEVDSSVVVLTPRLDFEEQVAGELSRFVRACFASRRKTLRRNIEASADATLYREACAATGIDPSDRAERVSPTRFLTAARFVAHRR